jgi:hypothetical protein
MKKIPHNKKYFSKEDILKDSLKCKTRTEFLKTYPGARLAAKKLGVLEEVCSHMIVKSYSTPQLILKQITENLIGKKCLYNDRKVLKPYELDLYFKEFNLAFEYNGNNWHKNDIINKKKLCDDKGITLITIIENSRAYEQDIKNQLINNINIINKLTNKNIKDYDILSITIDYKSIAPDLETIKNILLKYNDLYTFRINEPRIYSILTRNKLLPEYTKHMTRKRNSYQDSKMYTIKTTNDEIKKIISNYSTICDFIKDNKKLYLYLRRRKLERLLDDIYERNPLQKKLKKWNRETILNEINKYEYLKDFIEKSGGCYNAAIKLGMINEIKKLKHINKVDYNTQHCITIINTYTKLIDLINNDYGVYDYCCRHGLKHLFSHLEQRKRDWSEDELMLLINECTTIKEFSVKYKKAYNIARKRFKHLLIPLKLNGK